MTYTAESIQCCNPTSSLGVECSQMLACNELVEQSGLVQRQQLLKSVRGQVIRISDLHSLFRTWPEATSFHLSALRLKVEKTVEE